MVAEAVAEVADLTKDPNWPGPMCYSFACVYALASGKLMDKEQEYADRAMELLNKSVEAGYTHPVAVGRLKRDTDLAALRHREDFKKLLTELETKK